jgi:hypothetical protein
MSEEWEWLSLELRYDLSAEPVAPAEAPAEPIAPAEPDEGDTYEAEPMLHFTTVPAARPTAGHAAQLVEQPTVRAAVAKNTTQPKTKRGTLMTLIPPFSKLLQ